MRAFIICTLLLAASVLIVLAAQESQAERATVVGLSGQWKLDDGAIAGKKREVHFGQMVAKGASLMGEKGAHIVFKCEGQPFDNQSCPAGACQVHACAKETAAAGKDRLPWLTSSLSLISRNPDRFITAVTRGLGPEPWEAVVEMRADQLSLAPVLQPLPEGMYRLKLTNLPENPAFLTEHAIQWSHGGAADFAVPGIKPGVYSMLVVDGPGDIQGSEAWLLVAPGPTAASQLQTWEQVKQSIAPWREDVEPVYLHAFLRATLVSLSAPTSISAPGR